MSEGRGGLSSTLSGLWISSTMLPVRLNLRPGRREFVRLVCFVGRDAAHVGFPTFPRFGHHSIAPAADLIPASLHLGDSLMGQWSPWGESALQ